MKIQLKGYKEGRKNQEYHGRYKNLAGMGNISILIRTLKLYANFQNINELQDYFVETNPFNFSTRSYRARLFRSIKPLLLNTFNDDHKNLLINLASADFNQSFYKYILYLQVGLNSRLFREITLEVYAKKLKQGALKLTKHSIINFILDQVQEAENWTESSLDRLGSRYLTLMYMFDFIEGEGRDQIAIFSPSVNLLTYAVYLDQYLHDGPYLDPEAPIFRLLFINSYKQLIKRLKELSLAGYFKLETTGSDIKILSLLEVDKLADKLTR